MATKKKATTPTLQEFIRDNKNNAELNAQVAIAERQFEQAMDSMVDDSYNKRFEEETAMENTEVNLEQAAEEMAADTAAHNEAAKNHKKSNIKFGPWIPPTTKQLDAIISFGASFTYDEKIKWPALGTFDIEAAKHVLDQLHRLYSEGKMTRRYYPDRYKGYYAEKLKIARAIAAKWPETHMDPKLTTENSSSKH